MLNTIVILIGPPGAGKGSFAQLCQSAYNWQQVSTGELCRAHILEQTEIGKQIDFFIKNGKLITDRLISQMVEQWFIDNKLCVDTVILDGFPRTKGQAEELDRLLDARSVQAKMHIIEFEIRDEVVLERLASRRMCSDKACQRVYSLQFSELAPRLPDVCDTCSSALICRDDDNPASIKRRLKDYHEYADALREYYEKGPYEYRVIGADQAIEDIFKQVVHIVNEI